MVAYLDSSVALRHILAGEEAIRHAFALGSIVSSELIELECRRVIQGCRMDGDIDDDGFVTAVGRLEKVLNGIALIALSPAVKKRAMEAFPVGVKTLDVLHLASALVYAAAKPGETLVVFSHDASMNRCAKALGFAAPLSAD